MQQYTKEKTKRCEDSLISGALDGESESRFSARACVPSGFACAVFACNRLSNFQGGEIGLFSSAGVASGKPAATVGSPIAGLLWRDETNAQRRGMLNPRTPTQLAPPHFCKSIHSRARKLTMPQTPTSPWHTYSHTAQIIIYTLS